MNINNIFKKIITVPKGLPSFNNRRAFTFYRLTSGIIWWCQSGKLLPILYILSHLEDGIYYTYLWGNSNFNLNYAIFILICLCLGPPVASPRLWLARMKACPCFCVGCSRIVSARQQPRQKGFYSYLHANICFPRFWLARMKAWVFILICMRIKIRTKVHFANAKAAKRSSNKNKNKCNRGQEVTKE